MRDQNQAYPHWLFNRANGVLLVSFVLLILAVLHSSSRGAYAIPALKIPGMLWNQAGDGYEVLLNVRLPRVLLAIIVGAALGLAGATMQALFRNPLADPGLLGIISGASVGAAGWMILSHRLPDWTILQGAWGMPLMAFVGAMIAMASVWRLASAAGQMPIAILLLAGIAINAIGASILGFLIYLAEATQAQGLIFWMMGGLGAATWKLCLVTGVCFILAAPVILSLARPLDALVLGEGEAYHLGVRVERTKMIAVIACSIAVGGAVAAAGGIGFIGIVVPHLLRIVAGTGRHGFLLPASALAGGALLITADSVARTIVVPAELPVGIVMGFVGGPFLAYLLWKRRRQLAGNAAFAGASHA